MPKEGQPRLVDSIQIVERRSSTDYSILVVGAAICEIHGEQASIRSSDMFFRLDMILGMLSGQTDVSSLLNFRFCYKRG
jgi:hypothetical protein